MSSTKIRWVDSDPRNLLSAPYPDEHPGPGEALARMWPTGEVTEDDGRFVVVRLTDWRMSIEHNGRSLVARLPNEGDDYEPGKPQIPVDAADDLAGLLMEAWIGRPVTGRRSEQSERIAVMVDACREMGTACTRDAVAARLGRANDWGEPHRDFTRDVADAGGWAAIRRAAGLA